MKAGTALAAALLVLGFASGDSAHAERLLPKASKSQAEYDATLPPIGFVRYCMSNRVECEPQVPVATAPLRMTAGLWQTMFRINAIVNNQIEPVSDLDQYGEVERWTMPTTKGDCEDYVLLKRKLLMSKGFPSSALRITVLLDELRQGHAVLTVVTDKGDFILDNRVSGVMRPEATGYVFLKRQSAANPKSWVSLSKQQPKVSGVVAAPATP
jgi:predicted transglutaminase-like cysteine proteinase